MKVDVEVSELVERPTDDRGRLTLGSEYADKTVTVAVLEVETDE
jgi:hypothetical protein